MTTDGNQNDVNQTIKLLTEDIQAHREYIHKLYRSAFAAGAVIIAAGVGLGYWVLGKQLDARVFEYRIVDSLQDRAKEITTEIVKDSKVAAQKEVNDYIRTQIDSEVESLVEPKLEELSAENLPQLLERVAFPSGSVVAMHRPNCPKGWSKWEQGAGRVIIGAGQGQGLTKRSFGELGGEEHHKLTIAELPPHTHSTIQMVENNSVDGVDSATTRSFEHRNHSRQTGATGDGQAHNNMQPFIVLNLCVKE